MTTIEESEPENSPAIWPPYRAFYVSGMLFNTQSACTSIEIVSSIIRQLGQDYGLIATVDTHSALNELQNIVLQGAAVSKYLWPIRRGHEARGEQLRREFDIDETSPLYSRDLRNGIEHFDERLDSYLASGIVGNIIPEFFGISGDTHGVPTHYFRAFFVDSGEFQLLGDKYKIQPLAEALWSLNQALMVQDGRITREGPA